MNVFVHVHLKYHSSRTVFHIATPVPHFLSVPHPSIAIISTIMSAFNPSGVVHAQVSAVKEQIITREVSVAWTDFYYRLFLNQSPLL